VDCFLHVLIATDATVESVQPAAFEETEAQVRVRVGKATVSFDKSKVGGFIEIAGRRRPLPDGVSAPPNTTSSESLTP
jgi:hypothetical protein